MGGCLFPVWFAARGGPQSEPQGEGSVGAAMRLGGALSGLQARWGGCSGTEGREDGGLRIALGCLWGPAVGGGRLGHGSLGRRR